MIVYLIRNTIDGMGYVGQTTKTLAERFSGHRNCHRLDMPISVAIDRFGADCFTIELLQSCGSLAELCRAERDWIQRLGTLRPAGYNVNLGFGRRPETAARISAATRGRQFSAEHRARLAAASSRREVTAEMLAALARGRQQPRTPATRRRQSINNGRRKLTDDDVLEIRRAYSAREASQDALAHSFGVGQTTISRIVRGSRFRHLMQPDED